MLPSRGSCLKHHHTFHSSGFAENLKLAFFFVWFEGDRGKMKLGGRQVEKSQEIGKNA